MTEQAVQDKNLVAEIQRLRASQRRLSLCCGGVTLLALAGLPMGARAHRYASPE